MPIFSKKKLAKSAGRLRTRMRSMGAGDLDGQLPHQQPNQQQQQSSGHDTWSSARTRDSVNSNTSAKDDDNSSLGSQPVRTFSDESFDSLQSYDSVLTAPARVNEEQLEAEEELRGGSFTMGYAASRTAARDAADEDDMRSRSLRGPSKRNSGSSRAPLDLDALAGGGGSGRGDDNREPVGRRRPYQSEMSLPIHSRSAPGGVGRGGRFVPPPPPGKPKNAAMSPRSQNAHQSASASPNAGKPKPPPGGPPPRALSPRPPDKPPPPPPSEEHGEEQEEVSEVAAVDPVQDAAASLGAAVGTVPDVPASAVPVLVAESVAFLRAKSLQVSGLFRESANAVLLKQLQQRYNSGQSNVLADIVDDHTVAGLLKAHFRNMHSPIVPRSVLPGLVKAFQEGSFAGITAALHQLSEESFMLLVFLFRFLNEVSLYSDTNMMVPANLGICWAPTLCRSSGQMTDVVALLISHFETVFVR
jgi:RhoGAP domain